MTPPAQSPAFDPLDRVDVDDVDQLAAALQALVDSDLARFDPVRFRYIEALAAQAGRQRPAVARILGHKVLAALRGYRDDFEAAKQRAADSLECIVAEAPDREEELLLAFERGDFKAIQRAAGGLARGTDTTPFPALVQALSRTDAGDEPPPDDSLAAAMRQQDLLLLQQGSLPLSVEAGETADGAGAMDRLRQSLRAHHEQQRIARELHGGREDRGPLNAQALVVRSLEMMQEISPGYTKRFVAHMDTLLWLQRAAVSVDGKHKPRRKRRR